MDHRERDMKRIQLFVLAALMATSQMACTNSFPDTYSAEAIEARVIDAETQKPLEGVVIVAHWQLKGGMEGGNVVGQLMILETVTDSNGRFAFPAWGPLKRTKGHFDTADPQMLLFKPGYDPRVLDNERPEFWTKHAHESLRRSVHNGKTIEMKRFGGSLTSKEAMRVYADRLSFLNTSIDLILTNSADCNWKKIPRFILALNEQSILFRKNEIHGITSIDSLEVRYSNKVQECGSVKEFFKRYQQ